uniref:Uncharacterized protein n=1 Tax=viral metagenome TaxID=1070528 RepID=A0A6C0B163_9ZZZZ
MEKKRIITNPFLKRLVNVYQLQYTNGVAQGLGDYIRGSFCLLQIAALLGLQFDMDIRNHPMSKYIQETGEPYNNINYSSIAKYKNINYIPINAKSFKKNSEQFFHEFIYEMNRQEPKVENYYTFCNSFPVFDNYPEKARMFIKSKLQPNETLLPYIAERMKLLELSFKQFSVIHIRSGDKYLFKNNRLNTIVVRKIVNILKRSCKPNQKYLLLSDNNQIKAALKSIFPLFIIHNSSIVHLGEQPNMNDDKNDSGIRDTLIDFFIMSNASHIIGFSPYNWGSGFSQWCSVLYNIPFFQFQVLDTL